MYAHRVDLRNTCTHNPITTKHNNYQQKQYLRHRNNFQINQNWLLYMYIYSGVQWRVYLSISFVVIAQYLTYCFFF